MVKKIEELNINLIPEDWEDEYNQKRAEYIAEYAVHTKSTREYIPGGLFSSGYWTGEDGKYVKDPIQGEAEWNKRYPNGFEDWKLNNGNKLTCHGQQMVIDKINELTKAVNQLTKKR